MKEVEKFKACLVIKKHVLRHNLHIYIDDESGSECNIFFKNTSSSSSSNSNSIDELLVNTNNSGGHRVKSVKHTNLTNDMLQDEALKADKVVNSSSIY